MPRSISQSAELSNGAFFMTVSKKKVICGQGADNFTSLLIARSGNNSSARLPTVLWLSWWNDPRINKAPNTNAVPNLILHLPFATLTRSFHKKVAESVSYEVWSDQLLREVNPLWLIIHHDNVWNIDLWSLLTHSPLPCLRTTCLMHGLQVNKWLPSGALWYRAKWWMKPRIRRSRRI